MGEIKSFSLIIPAFKQEKTIVQDIKKIQKTLASLNFLIEIILVVDGLLDKTYEKASDYFSKKGSNVKIFSYEKNQGKGYAVKFGMLKAKGDVVGFIDAGMDIDISSLPLMLDYMKLNNADIVVGSKLHPDSKVKYPVPRRVLSWGYRVTTQVMFGFNVRDTQVGLKIFKKKVAKEIFPLLLVKKFAFDVEVLALARSKGYKRIVEAPVRLNFSYASSITSTNFWFIASRTLWDTAAVFYRLKLLKYYDKIRPIK